MAKNTVWVGTLENRPLKEEAKTAVGTILPGHALNRTAGLFVPTATNGEAGALYIADLNTPRQGGIDDLWTSGDSVGAFYPRAGELYHVRCAATQNITALDTPLTVNASGQFRIALTDGTEEIVAYAQEVINVSTANTLIRVRMANYGRAS
jgi:hypothetical protein